VRRRYAARNGGNETDDNVTIPSRMKILEVKDESGPRV